MWEDSGDGGGSEGDAFRTTYIPRPGPGLGLGPGPGLGWMERA